MTESKKLHSPVTYGPDEAASLSEGARLLLMAAAGHDGKIIRFRSYGGTRIKVPGHILEDPSPRDAAERESQLNELVQLGMVRQDGDALFVVTHEGYRVADEK